MLPGNIQEMDCGNARLPRILISTLDSLPKLTGVLPCEEILLVKSFSGMYPAGKTDLRNIVSGEFAENDGRVCGAIEQHASKCESIIDSVAAKWHTYPTVLVV